MKYLPRLLEKRVQQLFEHYPVVAVLGARQVGKSTMIENLFQEKLNSVVFDPVQDIGNARKDPDFFLQNHPPPVFLDEIQYAPELLASIKRFTDRSKVNGSYIISGSQCLSVLRNISESLAGRVAILHLLPMNFRELSEQTKQDSILKFWISHNTIPQDNRKMPVAPSTVDRIWRGAYPKVIQLPLELIPNFWESYLQTYIERDVRTVANVGSLQTFGRFFSILAASSAQEINHSHIGRELGVDRKTALQWTEIAEATFQWVSIPPFSRNPIKRIAGKSKGYFTDTGFISYLQRISSSQAVLNHPMFGRLFESFVVLEILKSFQDWSIKPNVYHYRSYAGAEVDLILDLDGRLYPIEIKWKTNPSGKDASGIRSLRDCFPKEDIAPGLIICSIESPQHVNKNTVAIPWWFL